MANELQRTDNQGQPMGVATDDVIPEKLKKVLPPEEGLRKILKGESISD